MSSISQEIHERAVDAAWNFKRAEAHLMEVLQEVESSRTYLTLGYPSLFAYTVRALGLTENVAANFITVARKAREIPELQSVIREGRLTISKARKITPVLTQENQAEWISKAQTLSLRRLEEEVARVCPREDAPERVTVLSAERCELRMGISKDLESKLRRVQDLESQRTRKARSLEETLEALVELYLESKDPVRRASRALSKAKKADLEHVPGHVTGPKESPLQEARTNDEPVPAGVRHEVHLRDLGRCQEILPDGTRCSNRRWIDQHHIIERKDGGANSPENLVTLCQAHHRMRHRARAAP